MEQRPPLPIYYLLAMHSEWGNKTI